MQGYLRKMRVVDDTPVRYFLRLSDTEVPMNPLIGGEITITYTGNIACVECGRKSKKSYSQGYCYPCFTRLPQCDLCMMSPTRCHYANGTCRDNAFGERFCMRPHLVYIANSSGIKVGLTHQDNIPTRWIDQGAVQAVPVYACATRQQAGFVEAALTTRLTDRTQWQRMLKAEDPHIDLAAERARIITESTADIADLKLRFGEASIAVAEDSDVRTFSFPMTNYPTSVKAINLDKSRLIRAKLIGIKAQYLVLDTGVINIRKYGGYEISLDAGPATNDEASQLSLL